MGEKSDDAEMVYLHAFFFVLVFFDFLILYILDFVTHGLFSELNM